MLVCLAVLEHGEIFGGTWHLGSPISIFFNVVTHTRASGIELWATTSGFSVTTMGDVRQIFMKLYLPPLFVPSQNFCFGHTAMVVFGKLRWVIHQIAIGIGLVVLVPDVEWSVIVEFGNRFKWFVQIILILFSVKKLVFVKMLLEGGFVFLKELVERHAKGDNLELGKTLGCFLGNNLFFFLETVGHFLVRRESIVFTINTLNTETAVTKWFQNSHLG